MAYDLPLGNTSTGQSANYGTTTEGYARAAYTREAALQNGQGITDYRSGAIGKNEQFHANTGHIYDSGNPQNFSSAGRATAKNSGDSFLGLFGTNSSSSSSGSGGSGGGSGGAGGALFGGLFGG
ncbi:hypothetical protein J6T21_02945 [Candidatus Saccharibacteria bacterium]|nr:hypothetical protein [Candidatus Saccharibacteria bacterium]